MSEGIKIEDEYSIAMFEDGTTEMIPKSWIQDFLPTEMDEPKSEKPETMSEDDDCSDVTYTYLKPMCTSNKNHHECICNDQRETLQRIAKDLEETKQMVKRLVNFLHVDVTSGSDFNLLQPIDTLEAFMALESHIRIKENYTSMVQNLCKVGGKTVEMTTRKIWNKLCSSELASKICWTGANGKHCLKRMLLNQVVRDSVLINFPDAKESEIQKTTMLWFSHAKDRLRSRKLL